MVRVTEELALSPEHNTLYYATDSLLGHLPVLIFHGPSTTANYTLNSSRVQIHVYSPAGFASFPRITTSPTSPFYNVVNYLPREFQGDEICRGLAFGLFKYFTELPEAVKSHVRNLYPTTRGRRPGSAAALFSEQHAADLAKSMAKSDLTVETIKILHSALQTQHISNVDIDFVLPPGSIHPLRPEDLEDVLDDEDDILDPTLRQFGMYTPLVKLFGEPIFLPTSRLRRAPSRPTSLNRGKSFTRDQKVDLRMKMGELVDTEERYVSKMNELVRHIADNFRQKAKTRTAGSISPTEDEVERLFPSSADRILQINSSFLKELCKVMDDTEQDAVNDMESVLSTPRHGGSVKVKDPSGALTMARIFLEWFPKFTDCYQDYIRASQHFPQLLNQFLDKQSSFRARVMQTGEQALRSILIEPVQRLPRYSLFIDQIVGCLPITHPALQLMLKARDIITNICSMDEPLQDKPQVANRLRNMIEWWPTELEPRGRLIIAVDYVELDAPYHSAPQNVETQDRAGIFLVFSDCIVMVKKKGNAALTSRDLLREVDKPSAAGLLASMTNAAGGPGSYEFIFSGWHDLADIRFTESADGRVIWMTSTKEVRGCHAGESLTSKAVTSRCFVMQESFEGKASKWTEEIVRARIEGRFSEVEREDPTWTLRSVRMPDNNFGLHAAVFQEAAEQLVEGRKEPAAIRVVLDNEKGTKGAPVGHYGVEIVVEVRTRDMKRLAMNTLGLNGKKYTDDVVLEDFLPTLSRRIVQLLSHQCNCSNHHLAPALVSYYTKVLRGLSFTTTRPERSRSFLGSSPVKLLSSFLGGTSTPIDPYSSQKQKASIASAPPLPPPKPPSRPNSRQDVVSLNGSIRDRTQGQMGSDTRPENPLVRLEQTFTCYVAALQSRKGQFVGRTLMNRSSVDELSVNDLYNRLIESPFDYESSSELGAEVIFAAFEKFARIAWREQMGPIMSKQALDALQERTSRRAPGDFADFVTYLFNDMAPQNRRAFTALIKLLADLLDGCGNDGDRGALTIAFAELLVVEGNAHDYINLLDRLVEDCDRVFDDGGGGGYGFNLSLRGSAYESLNSTARSQKSNQGSITSNTSSLRRKLGFDTLLRQNSKTDTERPSMWRTLSKHHRHPATGESNSLSKASVGRSRSIDMGIQQPSSPSRLKRPGSRDRPPIAGAFDDSNRPPSSHRPNSSHRLETIGEPEVEPQPEKTLKAKRRSSLSDLKSLMAAISIDDDKEETPMPLRITKGTSEKFNSSPRIPVPISKIPTSPQTTNLRSPRQIENIATFESPHRALASPSSLERPPRHGKTLSTSQIPTLRLARNPASQNGPESPVRPSTSPGKSPNPRLRLQSPQKLRERLETEKAAVEGVDASLKSELSRISESLARVTGSMPQSPTTEITRLTASVKALEERIPQMMAELTEGHAAIQRDLESTLKANEAKVKAIDQLFKESTAENELLYEKFNSELAKIVKALKGKGRDDKEELVSKLREQTAETANMKKDNARLRREMVSLRMLLKGGESN